MNIRVFALLKKRWKFSGRIQKIVQMRRTLNVTTSSQINRIAIEYSILIWRFRRQTFIMQHEYIWNTHKCNNNRQNASQNGVLIPEVTLCSWDFFLSTAAGWRTANCVERIKQLDIGCPWISREVMFTVHTRFGCCRSCPFIWVVYMEKELIADAHRTYARAHKTRAVWFFRLLASPSEQTFLKWFIGKRGHTEKSFWRIRQSTQSNAHHTHNKHIYTADTDTYRIQSHCIFV